MGHGCPLGLIHPSEQALREQLRSISFRDELLIAAIAAIESRQDPALVPALMDLLNDRGGALATRGLAQGLRSVGALASAADLSPRKSRV